MRISLGLFASILLGMMSASEARADKRIEFRIVDHIGRPTDGKISVKGPQTRSCTTVATRCSVNVTREGTYEVTVDPIRDKAPPPKSVKVGNSDYYNIVMTLLKGSSTSSGSDKPKVELDPIFRNPPGKNLARGSKQSVHTRIVDSAGRPTDGLIIVSQSGKTIGHASTVATRVDLYDLPVGKYSAKIYSIRGTPAVTDTFDVTKQAGNTVFNVK